MHINKHVHGNYQLSEEAIQKFKDAGYLKLNNFLSKDFVMYLLEHVRLQVCPPKDNFGAQFSKFKYDIMNSDQQVLLFVTSNEFASIVHQLISQTIFFTQGIGFSLEKNKGSGFPWHVGTQSFGFQRLEDYGVTIWIPLVPIRTKEQGGGMAYVPKNKLSGKFVYQHVDSLPGYISKLVEGKTKEEGLEIFLSVKHSLLNSPTMGPLLMSLAEEDDFELGDALIFDKYVIHRSIPLREGHIDIRHAFVMRFSCIDARYNQHSVNMLEYPRQAFSFAGSSNFNLDVCEKDGQLIRDSKFFKDSIEHRTVKMSTLEPSLVVG